MVFAIKNELGRLLDDVGNEISSPAAGDKIPLFDVSDKVVRYVTASNLAAIQEATEVATTLIARQDGGVAGTDEVQITHDGTDGIVDSKSGVVKIRPAATSADDFTVGSTEVVVRNFLRVQQNGGVFGTDEVQIEHDGTDGVIRSLSGDLRLKTSAAIGITNGTDTTRMLPTSSSFIIQAPSGDSIVIRPDNGSVAFQFNADESGFSFLDNVGDELLTWQFKDTIITTEQVLALNATPITLVPAPPAGHILVFKEAYLFLDYNSAAYADIAAGDDLAIRYTDASGAIVGAAEATGFLDQTSDQTRIVYPGSAVATARAEVTPVAASPLVLHMLAGEVTTGDSPLRVRVHYRTVDVSTIAPSA